MTEPRNRMPTAPKSAPRTRRLALALLLAASAGVAALCWPGPRTPAARWRGGQAGAAIEPLGHLPAEHPLRVELELPRPMHVYAASHDLVRGTIAMFPSAMLRSDLGPNPLPAGTHRLPGGHDGVALHWHAGDGVGATAFVVIASEHPLPDVAAALGSCRQMGNAAFPKRSILGTYAPEAGMAATPPAHRPAHPLLAAAAADPAPAHDGPMRALPGHEGVFATVLLVQTEPRTPSGDRQLLRAAVQERLAPLDGALQPPPAAPKGR